MADDHTTGRPDGPPPMRIGDADRQAMIDALQKHMGAGRLDMAEFERRVEHASGAIYDRDLDGLLDDLPPLADEAATGGSRDEGAARRGRRRAPRDRSGGWSPDLRGLRRPPWAWRGGVPAPLFALAAIALVVLTHGWILFPLLFLLFAFGRGPCRPHDHHRHAHRHAAHHGHGGHGGHGRRSSDDWEGRDGGRAPWWDAGDAESVWDQPAPARPSWPGRYDPDEGDDRIL